MNWYSAVVKDPSKIIDCIQFFESEYVHAKADCKIYGSIEKATALLPSITEQRFSQLQEIEAILEHLNIQLKQIKSTHYRRYLEHYARSLSSAECMKFVEGEQDVYELDQLINEFALVRNKWLSITKGLDQKSFALSNIIRLRCAGLDDASI